MLTMSNENHWALLIEKVTNIHHPGDERSRTNPGHGYPAYTETITSVEYIPFKTEELLKSYLILNEWNLRNKAQRIIFAQPLKIKTEISFEK